MFDLLQKSWFPGEKYITAFGNGFTKKMLGMQDDIASAVKVISIDQRVTKFDKSDF